jgi:hypothetical protein
MDGADDDVYDEFAVEELEQKAQAARRYAALEPVSITVEERGELPVSLADGVLRVGSSYALAGVASFWTPYAPVAEARCGAPRCRASGCATAGG